MYDVVISGARVMDPETNLDAVLNVGISGGTITRITADTLEGRQTIDGTGSVLSPGFIDIHTHEDMSPSSLAGGGFNFPTEIAACAVRTGNTTIVGGNCGGSNYPTASYLDALNKKALPVNCLSLVGNSTLRKQLGIGEYDSAAPEQIVQMKQMAIEALDEGAVGVSFGLQYAPGTSFEELIALCEAVAEKNKFFAVHMRYDTPNKAIETVDEVLKAAKQTGASLEISHYAANVYGQVAGSREQGASNIAVTAEMIQKAIDSGLDIAADVYPYDTWATSLKSAVFDNGFDDFNFKVEDLEILSGPLAGKYCTKTLFKMLRASPIDTAVACHNAIPLADIQAAYKLPFVSVGSDAVLSKVKLPGMKKEILMCHPRAAGSPARFLREFVLGNNAASVMPLMDGLRKLTLMPARKLKLAKKGRLQEGCDADLCLFDPETIADQATYGIKGCALPPMGIKAVIVGGKEMYKN
ncbi:MAG: amidohydrolase family protein [Spirochaetaceae bacterium]|jgi:N-acyl-D-amino-acid deacylase|nr:amidohydrolase family protein [Spirochaetaceae bacterium]